MGYKGNRSSQPHEEEKMATEESNSSDGESITMEEYSRYERQYWRAMAESEGFENDYVSPVVLITGLVPYDCQRSRRIPYPLLVKRYALLGLHRYNMLEGTSISLDALMNFNKSMNFTSSYYITLLAHDPDATPFQKTFQVRVDEKRYGHLDLTVSIARPKRNPNEAATKEPFIPHFHSGAVADGVFKGPLPDWPSAVALDDTKRFYVLKKSEWQDTDWISLYLELLVCASDREIADTVQSVIAHLQIVDVAIETKEEEDVKPPDERLNAKIAHVYIIFKGLAKSRRLVEIGEHVVRKAIIRRVIDASGYLTLLGKFWGGKDTEQQPSMTLSSGQQAESSKKRPRAG